MFQGNSSLGEIDLDEDLVFKAIDVATSKGAEYAEARLQSDESYFILIRNGALEAYGYSVDEGLSVRVIYNGAMGFSTTDNLDQSEVTRVAGHAFNLAKAQGGGEIGLSEETVHSVSYRVRPKKRFEDIDLSEKLDYLINIDKELASLSNDVKVPSRSIMVNHTITKKVVATNEGAFVRSIVPRTTIYFYIVVAKGDRSITRFTGVGGSVGWEAVDLWKPHEKIIENVKDLSKVVSEAKEVKSDTYDIILGPETSGLASHESCGHPFELDRIMGREGAQAGESFITIDMLGEKIASEEVTVIDDPTIPNSYGFYLYDEEGVRARPRYLIHKGVINEFLMNRETAYVLGTNSNAAARASAYNREPIVRMANTYYAPGTHTFEELLEGVKKGIFLKSFGEWNIDDRRYNMRFVGQEAYLIENGEIKHPVWNPIFEITTPAFYRQIDAVGKDLEFEPATCGKSDPGQGVPVYTGGPSMRIRNVRVFSQV